MVTRPAIPILLLVMLCQGGCKIHEQFTLVRDLGYCLAFRRVEMKKPAFRSEEDVREFLNMGRSQRTGPIWSGLVFVVTPAAATNNHPLVLATEPLFLEVSVFLKDGTVLHPRTQARLGENPSHADVTRYLAALYGAQPFDLPPASAYFVHSGKAITPLSSMHDVSPRDGE